MNSPKTSIVEQFSLTTGQIRTISAPGDFFLVVETSGTLNIARTGTGFSPYGQGDGEQLAEGETFDRLQIQNPNASTVQVTIFAGFGRRIQNRQSVVEPPTQLRQLFGGNLSAATTVPVSSLTTGATDIRRKALLVANGDASLRLQVLDGSGNVCSFIPPGQAHVFPVSLACGIRNPNGAAMEVYISEIVWTVSFT
jgi:hypothetical protein